MSVHAARFATPLPSSGLPSLLRRLREKLTIRIVPPEHLDKLSDHLLLDIGIDPRALRNPAQEASDRLHLVDHGVSRP